MMLSLSGIMLTVRGMFKGPVMEQDTIRREMDAAGVYDDSDQQQVDSLLLKDFVDGAMFTLEGLYMGSEEESDAIIAQSHKEQREWSDLMSEVEDEMLGGSLEDDVHKREEEWGPHGKEIKKLTKALEKKAKAKGLTPPRQLSKSTWRDAQPEGRTNVGQKARVAIFD
mmetsp:Transcript_41070/g.80313  ORF Transcript_41070/g.80313 Transcript_41070/m.80313 type:complete len:168 (-) Transcript_41070:189-692(-)